MLQCGINHRLKRQQGIRENTICCGVSCQHTICCGATIHESILFRIVEYPIAYRFSRKSRRDQGSRGYERHKYHKPISKTPLVKLHKGVSKNTGFYFTRIKRFCNICTKQSQKVNDKVNFMGKLAVALLILIVVLWALDMIMLYG